MCMRLTGIGSQYLPAMKDATGAFLDGARTYRLTVPPGIPEARFWSVTAYDRQTRSIGGELGANPAREGVVRHPRSTAHSRHSSTRPGEQANSRKSPGSGLTRGLGKVT